MIPILAFTFVVESQIKCIFPNEQALLAISVMQNGLGMNGLLIAHPTKGSSRCHRGLVTGFHSNTQGMSREGKTKIKTKSAVQLEQMEKNTA